MVTRTLRWTFGATLLDMDALASLCVPSTYPGALLGSPADLVERFGALAPPSGEATHTGQPPERVALWAYETVQAQRAWWLPPAVLRCPW